MNPAPPVTNTRMRVSVSCHRPTVVEAWSYHQIATASHLDQYCGRLRERGGWAGDGEKRVDERAPEQDESDEAGSTLPSDVDPEPLTPPVEHGAWLRDVSLRLGRAFAALLSIAVLGTMAYRWGGVGD